METPWEDGPALLGWREEQGLWACWCPLLAEAWRGSRGRLLHKCWPPSPSPPETFPLPRAALEGRSQIGSARKAQGTHLELGAPAAGRHHCVFPWPAPGSLAFLPILYLLLVFPEDTSWVSVEKPCTPLYHLGTPSLPCYLRLWKLNSCSKNIFRQPNAHSRPVPHSISSAFG